MQIRGLYRNRHFLIAFALTTAVGAAYLLASLFTLNSPQVFLQINTVLPPLAALTAAGMAARAAFTTDRASRRMWGGLALGYGLWALADLLWMGYTFLSDETPFPSLADLFWLLAYPAVYYALYSRVRALRAGLTPRMRHNAALITTAGLIFTAVFVLPPILTDFDPTRALEGLVNLAYPLFDLGVVVLIVPMLMLKEGRFALSWRLILAGTLLMTASDMLYALATWRDLYYPGGLINPLTALVDLSYSLAYFVTGFGFFLYRLIWAIQGSFDLQASAAPLDHYAAFLTTNHADRVITASDNLHILRSLPESCTFGGLPLAEALGASTADLQVLLEQAKTQEILAHAPLAVFVPGEPQPRQAWLTVQVARSPEGSYNGCNIALIANLKDPGTKRQPRNPDVQAMLRYLLARAGALPGDEGQAAQAYLLENLRLLAAVLYQYGGEAPRAGLFPALAGFILQRNLPLRLEAQTILLPDAYPGAELAGCLRALLQEARRYTAALVGKQLVQAEVAELHRQLDPGVLALARKYQLVEDDTSYSPYIALSQAPTA